MLRQDLTAPGPAGDAVRAEAGKQIAALGNAENESFGIELGCAYPDLPIAAASQTPKFQELRSTMNRRPFRRTAPEALFSMARRRSTTGSGHGSRWCAAACRRAPRCWLRRSAIACRCRCRRLDEPELERVYGRGLILARPDQHVAWRGGACDDTHAARAIVARALGWPGS